MLQKISDRIQGWVAGVIIAIIAAVFSLWGIEYYIGRDANHSKTVATVHGQKVSEKQLNSYYHQLQQRVQLSRPNKPITPQEQKQLKALALQQVITNTAMIHSARKMGFRVSPQEIQQLVMQYPAFQVNGFFSAQRFQRFLSEIRMTETQYIAQLQGNFMMNQVAQGLEASAFALPDEMQRAYALIDQKRSFDYFVLPLSKFLKGVKITAHDIQTYYQQHKNDYRTPEKVQVSYLLLSPEQIEKTIHISEAELAAYYKRNKAVYTTPKQWKIHQALLPIAKTATPQAVKAAERVLQHIQKPLKAGQAFDQVIKRAGLQSSTHTLTPVTASATLANVLATLKPGQVSNPFHTDKGVSLVKLISVTPEKVTSYASAKSQIHKRLAREKAQQILSQKSDQLSNLTYTNPDSLAVAAKQLGLTVQKSPWFSKQGLKKGLFANHAVIITAFSDDVLRDRNNSNLLELPNGAALVLRIAHHQASKVQSLSEVKQTIEIVLRKNKAESKAGLEAYQISSALEKKGSPETLAKRYGVTWVKRHQVKRDNKTTTPLPILTAAFTTPPAKGNKHTGVNTLVMANGDYVIIKVVSSELANASKAEPKQRTQLNAQLARLNGNLDYRFYGKSVMNNAKIKITGQ